MRKLIFIFMILFSLGSLAQTDNSTTSTAIKEVTESLSLKETLQPYVKKLLEGIDKGATWTAEQVPEVIQQYLWFEAARYGLILILGFLFLNVIRKGISRIYLKKSVEKPTGGKSYHDYREVETGWWLRYDSDKDDWTTFEQVFHPIAKFACYLTGALLIICNIASFVKVTFFPKLYLVEKFIELI